MFLRAGAVITCGGAALGEESKNNMLTTPFAASIMLKATSDDDDEWIVSGPAASLERDYDGEVLEKAGLIEALRDWCTRFKGHVDYEHGYSRSIASGKPDPDLIIAKGIDVTEVDGKPWVVVKLLKGKALAEKVWRHLKAGGEMGFSLEGKGAYDPHDRTRRIVTAIHRMTIAPIPKGYDQTLQIGRPLPSLGMVAKALVESVEQDNLEWASDLYSTTVDLSECRWKKAADAPVMGDMLTQDQAHYRPNGSEWACRNCAHYDGDDCNKVQGTIRPEGNCDYFELPPGSKPSIGGETAVVVVETKPAGNPIDDKLEALAGVRQAIRKAFTTGMGIVADGDTGGRSLRRQTLDGSTRSATYGGKRVRKPKKRIRKAVEPPPHGLTWKDTGGEIHAARASHGLYGVVPSPQGGHVAYYSKKGENHVRGLGHGRTSGEAKAMCAKHHRALMESRQV
jgi:hypothetical protein